MSCAAVSFSRLVLHNPTFKYKLWEFLFRDLCPPIMEVVIFKTYLCEEYTYKLTYVRSVHMKGKIKN